MQIDVYTLTLGQCTQGPQIAGESWIGICVKLASVERNCVFIQLDVFFEGF